VQRASPAPAEVEPVSVRTLAAYVIAALALAVALSPAVWSAQRDYPAAPLFYVIPSWVQWPIRLAALASLAAMFMGRRARWLPIVFAAGAALEVAQDQTRLQPWFYEYATLATLLGLALIDGPRAEERVRNACCVILACIYLWSGLHKLNDAFIRSLVPWLLEPLEKHAPGLSSLHRPLGWVIPWLEAALGPGLLWTRTRRAAVVGAIAMHGVLLLLLGPLARSWNSVVWPWNAAMILLVHGLFWRNRRLTAAVLWNGGWWPHVAVLAFFALGPVLSFVEAWDDYPAFCLYTGNPLTGDVRLSRAASERLPPAASAVVRILPDGRARLPIEAWSQRSLGVPAYPSERAFRSIAQTLCPVTEGPQDLELVVYRTAGWLYQPGWNRVFSRTDLCGR
jgi:hypothetical protein